MDGERENRNGRRRKVININEEREIKRNKEKRVLLLEGIRGWPATQ